MTTKGTFGKGIFPSGRRAVLLALAVLAGVGSAEAREEKSREPYRYNFFYDDCDDNGCSFTALETSWRWQFEVSNLSCSVLDAGGGANDLPAMIEINTEKNGTRTSVYNFVPDGSSMASGRLSIFNRNADMIIRPKEAVVLRVFGSSEVFRVDCTLTGEKVRY